MILLAGIDSVKVESGEVEKRFSRREMPKEALDFYMDLYAKALKDTLSSDENIYSWTSQQVHIASANMMSAGAVLGIDSCPIGGFEKENVEDLLNIDTTKYQVSLVLPFGYRLNPQPEQLRLPFDDVVEFIN